MSGKIIVIGSMNADLVIHSPKMPQIGETLTGSNFQVNAGGKGLNQAVAIAEYLLPAKFFLHYKSLIILFQVTDPSYFFPKAYA